MGGCTFRTALPVVSSTAICRQLRFSRRDPDHRFAALCPLFSVYPKDALVLCFRGPLSGLQGRGSRRHLHARPLDIAPTETLARWPGTDSAGLLLDRDRTARDALFQSRRALTARLALLLPWEQLRASRAQH